MGRKRLCVGSFVVACGLATGVALGGAEAATWHETVLHAFTSSPTDGNFPYTGLTLDGQGNLYGGTSAGSGLNSCLYGSVQGCGMIYKIAPDGTETILYNFCPNGGSDCPDGDQVVGGNPVVDKAGNIYGTTDYGGVNGCGRSGGGCGVVFKLTPTGSESVLYAFAGGNDGELPTGGVIEDRKGNFYGTTTYGGTADQGTVFEVEADGTEKVLYSFCQQQNCTDGAGPWNAKLLRDRSGNLYGTTTGGGSTNSGVVFEISARGSYSVLHSFCPQGGSPCSDGVVPFGAPIMDSAGNLYGTTYYGGTSCNQSGNGCGTIWKIAPGGTESVVYAFTGGTDGYFPQTGLTPGRRGKIYGTTEMAGSVGTIFELSRRGKLSTLYTFCQLGGCADGSNPQFGVIADRKGNLFGATVVGGPNFQGDCSFNGCGTVFELTN